MASRWTRRQLDEVRDYFLDRWNELEIDTVSEPVDEAAQPSIEVRLVRITNELANWAADHPPGRLTFRPP